MKNCHNNTALCWESDWECSNKYPVFLFCGCYIKSCVSHANIVGDLSTPFSTATRTTWIWKTSSSSVTWNSSSWSIVVPLAYWKPLYLIFCHDLTIKWAWLCKRGLVTSPLLTECLKLKPNVACTITGGIAEIEFDVSEIRIMNVHLTVAVATKGALHGRFAKTAKKIVSQTCNCVAVAVKCVDWVVQNILLHELFGSNQEKNMSTICQLCISFLLMDPSSDVKKVDKQGNIFFWQKKDRGKSR